MSPLPLEVIYAFRALVEAGGTPIVEPYEFTLTASEVNDTHAIKLHDEKEVIIYALGFQATSLAFTFQVGGQTDKWPSTKVDARSLVSATFPVFFLPKPIRFPVRDLQVTIDDKSAAANTGQIVFIGVTAE